MFARLTKVLSVLLVLAMIAAFAPALVPAVSAQAPGTCPGGYPNGTTGNWNGAPQVCCNGVWQWGSYCPLSITPPNGWNPGVGSGGTNGGTIKSLVVVDSAAFYVTGPAGDQVLVNLRLFKPLPAGYDLAFGGFIGSGTGEAMFSGWAISSDILESLGSQALGVAAFGGGIYLVIEARYGRGTVKRLWDLTYAASYVAGTILRDQLDSSHLRAERNNAYEALVTGGFPPNGGCWENANTDGRGIRYMMQYAVQAIGGRSGTHGVTNVVRAIYNMSDPTKSTAFFDNDVSTLAGFRRVNDAYCVGGYDYLLQLFSQFLGGNGPPALTP